MISGYSELRDRVRWETGREMLGLGPSDPFNVCERVIDRQLGAHAEKIALIARDHENRRMTLSFADLHAGICRFARVLDELGIRKGDRVFTLMEPYPELYYALLGTIRCGAIAGPLFSAFGAEAVSDRLIDSGTRVLVTTAHHLHKVRSNLGALPALEHVLVLGEADLGEREHSLSALLKAAEPSRDPTPTSDQDPMLIHYSSGTTGKPKGVLHVHEALVGHALTARIVLDLKPEDTYWCTADPGWVTGTSYGIFGPWANGITQVAYVGGFGSEAWYRIIENERVTVWYTSPTALRMLMRDGTEAAKSHDLSSLRYVMSVGEPLNPEVIRWGEEAYGHTIRDNWWQTETGCIQIANYPFMEVRPGSMGRPFAGVEAAVLNPTSHEPAPPGQEGLLALKPPWPSMFRTYWNRPELYAEKFVNGWYITGDRAYMDSDGAFWFVGRDDDVINTSGHLVGPFEVESALLQHVDVVEAAAFPIPSADSGQAVAAKVVLRGGAVAGAELLRDLRTLVRRQVGGHAVPRELQVVDRLPRTRSGKIMRRVARAEFLGLPLGDVSALED